MDPMTDTTIHTTAGPLARAIDAAHAHSGPTGHDPNGFDALRIDVRDGVATAFGTDLYSMAAATITGTTEGPDTTTIICGADADELADDTGRLAALEAGIGADLPVTLSLTSRTVTLTRDLIRRTYWYDPDAVTLAGLDWRRKLADCHAQMRTDAATPLLSAQRLARFDTAGLGRRDYVQLVPFGAHADFAGGVLVTVGDWCVGAVMGCTPDDHHPAADVLAAFAVTAEES